MKGVRRNLVRAVRNIAPISTADLGDFLEVFGRRRAAFFLGSGASVPLLPTVAEQREIVRRIALTRDLYEVEVRGTSELARQLGLDNGLNNASFEEAFRLARFNQLSMVIAYDISLASCAASCANEHPDQYGVFRLTDPTAVILTTNNDGLARRCSGRAVVELHGALAELRINGRDRVRVPDAYLPMINSHLHDQLAISGEFPWRPGPIPAIVRPGDRLPAWLMDRFIQSWEELRIAEVLIDVGYSLPGYDEDVRDLLRDGFRSRGRQVWILTPDPIAICDEMGALLASNQGRPWPVRWDCLAGAIANVVRTVRCTSLRGLRFHLQEVCLEYGHQLARAQVLAERSVALVERDVEDVFADPSFLALEGVALAVRFGLDPSRDRSNGDRTSAR